MAHPMTRWPSRALLLLLLLLVLVGAGSPTARADEPVSVSYHMEGFSADGKYAVFRKELSDGCRELSLVVYETATRRTLAASPVLRDGKGCTRPIAKPAGLRERARLMSAYGPFAPHTRLEPRGPALVAPDLRVTLEVQGTYPTLDLRDADRSAAQRAKLRLRLVAVRGAATLTLLDKHIVAAPVRAPGIGEAYLWHKAQLSEGQLSANGRVLALVVNDQPELFTLPTR